MKIKKGDTVKIISGKDRGKTGTVIRVFSVRGGEDVASKISVEGINLYKKRVRPKRQGEKGQTVLVPRPLAASNVKLVCKNCKRATRVGMRIEGGRKVRYCKKCKAAI